jgi:lipoate---protein ligase
MSNKRTMLCIHLTNNNPFFCLGAEEYLLKNFSDDIFLLWQSHDTVVVGKHQNALAEINYPFIWKNKITVARRISGGGAVFHDAGNVNFAIIENVKSPAEINFSRFTRPIVEALAKLGITAVPSGRNDLLVKGKKISGNAEHVFKNRVLHHGTLLYNSSLETLGRAIKAAPGKYHDKAVQSNRSQVTNIAPFLKKEKTTKEFISFLTNFQQMKTGNSFYSFNKNELQTIKKLAEEKFQTWEWNYGYSPKYTFKNETIISEKKLKVTLNVEKGYITSATVSGNYFPAKNAAALKLILEGKRHIYEDIRLSLKESYQEVQDESVFTFF